MSRTNLTSALTVYNKDMKLKSVLITIGLIMLTIWVIGILLKIAGWFIHLFVVVAGVLLIIGVVRAYIDSKRQKS